jgi:hypothetical protein
VAVTGKVSGAQIVGEDDDDVGALGLRVRWDDRWGDEKGEGKKQSKRRAHIILFRGRVREACLRPEAGANRFFG